MRDLSAHLRTSPAFPELFIPKDMAGEPLDLQGFQSLVLNITWQQRDDGHSKEKGLQLIFEEGHTPKEMNPVPDGVLQGHRPYGACIIHSQSKNLAVQNLWLGYYGSCRFVRLRALVTGGTETLVSGVFIMGLPSVSPTF